MGSGETAAHEAAAFFEVEDFKRNQIGAVSDADELARKFHADVPLAELVKRPSAPLDDPRFLTPSPQGVSE